MSAVPATPAAGGAIGAGGRRPSAFRLASAVALSLVLVFLVVPLVSIFVEAGPGELWDALGSDAALDALASLSTAAQSEITQIVRDSFVAGIDTSLKVVAAFAFAGLLVAVRYVGRDGAAAPPE